MRDGRALRELSMLVRIQELRVTRAETALREAAATAQEARAREDAQASATIQATRDWSAHLEARFAPDYAASLGGALVVQERELGAARLATHAALERRDEHDAVRRQEQARLEGVRQSAQKARRHEQRRREEKQVHAQADLATSKWRRA